MQKTNYAVQINSKEEFDTLMEYYDKVGWINRFGGVATHDQKISWLVNYSFKCYVELQNYFSIYNYQPAVKIVTLSQAKEKIRHMKAYKEWSKKQSLKERINSFSNVANQTPSKVINILAEEQAFNQESDIDYSKIKAGDKVLVEIEVKNVDSRYSYIEHIGGQRYYLDLVNIKKHIPVKSALEVAEERLLKIENDIEYVSSTFTISRDDLDLYYQARKKFEELKAKNQHD